jgi:hypothetical protein
MIYECRSDSIIGLVHLIDLWYQWNPADTMMSYKDGDSSNNSIHDSDHNSNNR